MGQMQKSGAHHVDEIVGVLVTVWPRRRIVISFVVAVHSRRRDTPGAESQVVHDVEIAVLVVPRVSLCAVTRRGR